MSKQIRDHFFKPVAAHPDDDGTDATYCGEPERAHWDGWS